MKNANPKKKIMLILILIMVIIITIIGFTKLLPFLTSLNDTTNRENFKNYIDNLGFLGILLVILIQTLQVFIAFIPGEIVELLAGLLYGTWIGLLICLIGNAIGSFLIYIFVKTFAKKYTLKTNQKLQSYSFLNNKKKIAIYLFLLYLIPGIPKDIVTYIVPFLPINFISFIIVTSIARIPSIISSTYSSNSFLNNNYTMAIIMIVIFTILAILGFIFKDKILKKMKADNEKEITDNTSK